MARRGGIALAPFVVAADGAPNPGGYPRGGETRVRLADNHLGYAITWFGLAAAAAAIAAVRAREGRRGDRDARLS